MLTCVGNVTNVIRFVVRARFSLGLCGWAALGCSDGDATWLTGVTTEPAPAPADQPAAVGEPAPPPEAAAPVFPGSPAFLSMPETLSNELEGFAPTNAFPNLGFVDPVALVPVPGTNRLALVERGGRIYTFENQPQESEVLVALDIEDVTVGIFDSGMLSLAFHPKFGAPGAEARNYAYVWYAFSQEVSESSDPGVLTPTTSRLSRFDVDPVTGVFDAGSELVLISQLDESLYHEGGAMLFHPRDGFLYLSMSDEGRAGYNVQHIERDLFSGVLRIDVDQQGGDISHPIPKQPESGQTANYFIPNDNPFVGQPGALEEFYAIGLRNPHRMSYDPVDDHVWIADVGAGAVEEIDILAPAANYQWNLREGTTEIYPTPAQPIGVWTDPILTLPHGVANAIIGGYVYRGTQYPQLRGKYVFGDFLTGTIWALSYENQGASVLAGQLDTLAQTDFRGTSDGITSFGLDAAGELYFLNVGRRGHVSRLVPTSVNTNAPALLSETGAFADLAALTPAAGAVPYSVNSPFWSDGASKRRWLALPAGGGVEFAADGAWRFPEGTVFIKQFSMAFDETRPTELRPLETRLLVAGAGGDYYGVTYKWNAEGTDATAVLQREEVELAITGADGQSVTRPYVFPGPTDCMVCHNAAAGHVLGVRSEQLNRRATEADLPGTSDNQIERWSEAGIFTQPVALAPSAPALAALDDESRSVEDRLRSYWAANCSFCHGTDETVRANWDARYSTPLAEQGIIGGPLVDEADAPGAAVVAPGDPELSVMYQRGAATEAGVAMPPIGRKTADERYLALLQSWIESLR
jgi:uncharacterized repeat protein (TIGR03806 family)